MAGPQRLSATAYAYRIGDPEGRFPIYSAEGARLAPGRWHHKDHPVIYASEHYSTAMLEKLAHAAGVMPDNQHWIQVTLPRGLSYEVVTPHHLPGWDSMPAGVSRNYGYQWAHAQRSAVLYVPSFVARMESNIIINPDHPEFNDIEPDERATPTWWDERLYSV